LLARLLQAPVLAPSSRLMVCILHLFLMQFNACSFHLPLTSDSLRPAVASKGSQATILHDTPGFKAGDHVASGRNMMGRVGSAGLCPYVCYMCVKCLTAPCGASRRALLTLQRPLLLPMSPFMGNQVLPPSNSLSGSLQTSTLGSMHAAVLLLPCIRSASTVYNISCTYVCRQCCRCAGHVSVDMQRCP
jgi:hypothetical protein